MRTLLVWLCILGCLLFAAGAAQAQSSATSISFQGALNGVNGLPLANGRYDLTFRFYASGTTNGTVGGNAAATVTSVPVTNGVVSTAIPVQPAWFDGQTRWLGISVNGAAELAPRVMMTSVPYALKAQGAIDSFTVGPATTELRARLFLDGAGPEVRLVDRQAQPAPREWIIEQTSPAGNSRLIIWNRLFDGPLSDPITILPDGRMGIRRTYEQMQTSGGTLEVGGSLVVAGDTRTRVLQITGGSDLAEPFDVVAPSRDFVVRPGMVMVIDRERDGKLTPCSRAYDTAVAGIISGANGLQPGMIMKAEGQPYAEGEHLVAMTGRVWCHADAGSGPIRRGDRLTTSATLGHAMRVGDEALAPGAVIGKAMTELESGTGLVLVLVNLQ